MSAGRRIFVGDVQGCVDPLQRLLAECGFAPDRDRLFFTGDLVNKGPANAEVLRLAMRLRAETVLGNHDVVLLELAKGSTRHATHTLDDVLRAPDRDDLVGWLHRRPLALDLGDVFLVHGAVRPTWRDLAAIPALLRARFDAAWNGGRDPLDDPDVKFALTARFCTAAGEQADPDWPPPGEPYRNWSDLYAGDATVVFGHFARQGLVVRAGLRGLDTGCVYGGALTAWIAEEDRIVSVH